MSAHLLINIYLEAILTTFLMFCKRKRNYWFLKYILLIVEANQAKLKLSTSTTCWEFKPKNGSTSINIKCSTKSSASTKEFTFASCNGNLMLTKWFTQWNLTSTVASPADSQRSTLTSRDSTPNVPINVLPSSRLWPTLIWV